jgi:hypothetical protein
MRRFNLLLSAVLVFSGAAFVGCSEEVSHSETDKPNILDNGRTHEEKTVYKNPDGTYTAEHSKTRTSE